jgi:hypothetical protein
MTTSHGHPSTRRSRVIRSAGLAFTAAYAILIVWLYAQQPQTVAQVTGGLTAAVGAYAVDRASFEEGLAFFRRDQFPEARAAFERADPADRDPTTQFYLAYSYYREGWGPLRRDDRLYRLGLEALDVATKAAPAGRIVVDDPDLGMRSADELRAEFERGLTVTPSDFNPLRVLEKRK